MPIFQARELLQLPNNPDNTTDTVINGIHFNRTALNFFNYTLYSNGTLSNGTNCWLTFDIYRPHMLPNGTFFNATSCYSPIKGIRQRGGVGIAFASLFAATILFTLANLRKHGRRLLPAEKRWKTVGRRWQWYWMIFVAACGAISCFTSIDVDRDYIPSSAIILQSLFYHLMLPAMLAAVWEGVRHWGSWQERQICNRDTHAFEVASSRERQEFYLPLIFYLFAFLNFFLTVPRSWTAIEKQRSFEQQESSAKPSATDARFKAASMIAIVCLLIIVYSLGHSIYRYKERPTSRLRLRFFYLTSTPSKFVIAITLAAIRVGYGVASSFLWSISPMRFNVSSGWLYGLGYSPLLLILIVFNIYGYMDPNEDKALALQRAERDRALAAQLGIDPGTKKPGWWRRVNADFQHVSGMNSNSRARSVTTDTGGGRPSHQNFEHYLEMDRLRTGQGNQDAYRDAEEPSKTVREDPPQDRHSAKGGRSSFVSDNRSVGIPSNTGSQLTTSSGDPRTGQARAQVVRSMLDI